MMKHDKTPQGTALPDPSPLSGYLVEARESRGLSQSELTQRAGLPPGAVAGLEAGRFNDIGAPVFVRGYLIRYCRALGLPEEGVLERYRALGFAGPPPLRLRGEPAGHAPRGQGVLRPFAYLLLLVLLGYVGWRGFEVISARFVNPGTAGLGQPDAAGRQELALPNAAAPAQPAPTATAVSAEAATLPSPVPVPSAPATTATPPAATPPAAAAAATPAPVTPAGEMRLEVEFSADSWAEIRDASGKVLLNGIIRAGSSRTLSGRPPFKCSLGNAQAVQIKLDGQPVDSASFVPKRGSVARFTLPVAG